MSDPAPGQAAADDASPEARLAALGLSLPKVVAPLAAYVPAVLTGNYVYTAGQLPFVDGVLPATGKVGAGVGTAEASALARICALNALAAVVSVTGSLSAVRRIVKVTGFVASAPDFLQQAQVAEVLAVGGGVLADQEELTHPLGRQPARLGDQVRRHAGHERAAERGDRAEAAPAVAA